MSVVRRGERRILIMKVVAINGSARKDGNTAILVRHVFSALEEEGIRTMRVLGENMAWVMKKLYG